MHFPRRPACPVWAGRPSRPAARAIKAACPLWLFRCVPPTDLLAGSSRATQAGNVFPFNDQSALPAKSPSSMRPNQPAATFIVHPHHNLNEHRWLCSPSLSPLSCPHAAPMCPTPSATSVYFAQVAGPWAEKMHSHCYTRARPRQFLLTERPQECHDAQGGIKGGGVGRTKGHGAERKQNRYRGMAFWYTGELPVVSQPGSARRQRACRTGSVSKDKVRTQTNGWRGNASQ